jgi:hypothetical protein
VFLTPNILVTTEHDQTPFSFFCSFRATTLAWLKWAAKLPSAISKGDCPSLCLVVKKEKKKKN